MHVKTIFEKNKHNLKEMKITYYILCKQDKKDDVNKNT